MVFLAYAVGFGGSMLWFGSSVGAWIKGGWHVLLAYVVGFAVMLAFVGWQPDLKLKKSHAAPDLQAPRDVNSVSVKP